MIDKINPTFLKGVPIVGWILVFIGVIFPPENVFIRIGWFIILFACAGLHTIQLLFSVPLGRRMGLGYPEIIFKTLLFGATWWMPLKNGILAKAKN